MTMTVDLLTSTHAGTTRQSIQETTRQLVSHLGPTAVSFLAGSKNSKQSHRWAKPDAPEPLQPARERLLTAHRIWTAIATTESDYVARNWFIAANPRLDEETPLSAIRNGDLRLALAAAEAFLDGTDG